MFGRKSGVDMVDFTRTKSGKKIAPPKEIAPSVGGFLDFTSQNQQTPQPSSQTETPNTFGFLSDFSQSVAQQNTQPKFFTDTNTQDSSHINSLKIKIEDLEFKMERLLERLAEMETKFGRM
jgi:hypothetical protein